MLDFNDKIYKKILTLGAQYNILANCREYPSLMFNREYFGLEDIRKNLSQKLADPEFACGLYVHFPFCRSRCSFCKYYSEISSEKGIFDRYSDLLEKELELYRVNFFKVEFDNLCLGGGTPTLLDEWQIERYMNIIHRFFRFKKGAQISIEGTPETVVSSRVKKYNDLGINRLSLGVQSLNDEILKKTGRLHKVKDVFKAFEIIRQSGIKYIAVDIMWGLPGESLSTYEKTIRNIIKLSPEFVEGFLLTIGGRVKVDRFCPSGVVIDEIINFHKNQFLSSGYQIYFLGNFLGVVKKGFSRLKTVNQNTDGLYNHRADVLGVGVGASSHFDSLKYKIVSDFKGYSDSLSDNSFPSVYGARISRDDSKRQYVISRIGFFRYINKKRYYQIFGKDLADDFSNEINYLKDKKIVHETKNEYRWVLDEHEMGHKSFFMHIIKYWYHPKQINQMIEIISKI